MPACDQLGQERTRQLDECADVDGIDESAADILAIRAWSLLHGLTSLRLHKPTMVWPTTVEEEVAAIAAALADEGRPREG